MITACRDLAAVDSHEPVGAADPKAGGLPAVDLVGPEQPGLLARALRQVMAAMPRGKPG